MDLIYTNQNKEDVGVLSKYEIDIAFGSDENDFECKINKENHCCEDGWFLYIEGTEYGGIIDKFEVSTEEEYVTYKGRSWHGIMAEAVIVPPNGQDYLQISGECNAAIRVLVNHVNLGDLFEVSTEDSGIIIYDISRFRYSNLYDSIRNMLFGAGAKLKIEYRNGKVLLSAVPYVDYSQNEEWDASQIRFKIEKNFKPVNHIICLGNGELKDRHVIHLFADKYGEIQPYKRTESPVKDADYILDTSSQKMFGIDERTTILDYPNATDRINYVVLTEKPSDWDANYEQYFRMSIDAEGSGKYTQLSSNTTSTYNPLKSKPSDWDANCEKYYEIRNYAYASVQRVLNSDMQLVTTKPADWNLSFGGYYWYDPITDIYSKVAVTVVENYTQLSAYPSDWSVNYSNYYQQYNDGTGFKWKAWQGVNYDKYVLMTSEPSDWKTNYKSYYVKDGKEYVAVKETDPKFVQNKYYRKESYTVAPEIEIDVTGAKPNVWIRDVQEILPDFNAKPVYQECGTYIAPTWQAGKYYIASVNRVSVEWQSGMYYKAYTDHYASLVESGLAKFEEYKNCNSIETNLDASKVYDIGDVVGASEQVTGIAVWQPITKKIVTLKDNNVISIEYKIGE